MAQVNIVPKIRFPEFEDFWNEKKMGEVFINSRKKGNALLPIYSVSQAHGLISRDSLERNIQKNAKAEDNLAVVSGDLVYNMMRMWQGAIGLAHTESMVSPAYVVLHPKKNQNSTFYSYLFAKKRSLYLFWAYSYGLTDDRLRLYFKDFSDIKRNVPSYSEQQKIASFLTAVDQRIQLLQKKKAKLEEYKKGVMHQLFPAKAGQAPEIRFKDENGNNFPDWEEKKLGNLTTISKGKQLNKSELTEEGEYPCQNGGIDPSGYTREYNTDENTITISEGGNSCGYVNFMKSKFWCGGHCYALINLKESVKLSFLFQSLKFNQRNLMRLRVGSGLPNIQKGDVTNFKIPIPSRQEQTKLSTFLSSIDEAIDSIGQEMDGTTAFKKGLLQKMFV